MTKIYLIRHGETIFNKEHKIAGQIETDLTELGRLQALETGKKLQSDGVKFDVILCSTLKRAKDTAKIIAQNVPAPIIYDDNLKEFSNGIYEGTKIEDLEKIIFEPPYKTSGFEFSNGTDLYAAYSSFDPCYDMLCYPKGETKRQACERFMSAIKHYLDTHHNTKNLCVVAHGAVIRFMLLKICPDSLIEKIKNAEVRIVLYDHNKGFYCNKQNNDF